MTSSAATHNPRAWMAAWNWLIPLAPYAPIKISKYYCCSSFRLKEDLVYFARKPELCLNEFTARESCIRYSLTNSPERPWPNGNTRVKRIEGQCPGGWWLINLGPAYTSHTKNSCTFNENMATLYEKRGGELLTALDRSWPLFTGWDLHCCYG